MIITLLPEVIPVHAFACDDVFLLRKLALNFVRTMPFTTKDARLIDETFLRVIPCDPRDKSIARIVPEQVHNSMQAGMRVQHHHQEQPSDEERRGGTGHEPKGLPKMGEQHPCREQKRNDEEVIKELGETRVMSSNPKPTETCNMLASLPQGWITADKIEDSRYACSGDIGKVAPTFSADEKPDQRCIRRLSSGGEGCRAKFDAQPHDMRGWVQGFFWKGKHLKNVLMYPWKVTIEIVAKWQRVVVPCEHLQLYFEVMFLKTLDGSGDTVEIGFHKLGKLTQLYYVARVHTRTKRLMKGWTDSDREKMLLHCEEMIVLEYLDTMNSVLKPRCIEKKFGITTTAEILGCSGLVGNLREIMELVAELIHKFLPAGMIASVKERERYKNGSGKIEYVMIKEQEQQARHDASGDEDDCDMDTYSYHSYESDNYRGSPTFPHECCYPKRN
jgi:hypothetical protein